jgi:hypothetical protein
MTDTEQLSRRIFVFLDRYALSCTTDERNRFIGFDSLALHQFANALADKWYVGRGSLPLSRWTSGCYGPVDDLIGRAEHDEILIDVFEHWLEGALKHWNGEECPSGHILRCAMTLPDVDYKRLARVCSTLVQKFVTGLQRDCDYIATLLRVAKVLVPDELTHTLIGVVTNSRFETLPYSQQKSVLLTLVDLPDVDKQLWIDVARIDPAATG